MRLFTVKNTSWTFPEPNEVELARIRASLIALPIVSETKLRLYLTEIGEEYGETSDIDNVLSKLYGSLIEDFHRNLAESADAPWSFDYFVERDGYKHAGLSVLTRLVSPDPTQGNILYGSQFYRLGDIEFVCWIDSAR